MKAIVLGVSSVLLASLLTTPIPAQEKKAAAKEPDKKAGAPDMAEMMAKWMAAATPGKEHEFLKKQEGKWKVATKSWFSGPDQPAMESTGTSTSKLILGGRFLLDEHEGTMMGMPFKGMAITGYDNTKKKYVGSWCDNMGTCLLTMEGSCDKSGKVLTMHGPADDITTGEHDKLMRYITRIESDDKYIFEIFDVSGAEPVRLMEMTCTRQK